MPLIRDPLDPIYQTCHIQTPGRITIKLLMRCFDQQATGGDLEGAHIPPSWRDWCWCTVS